MTSPSDPPSTPPRWPFVALAVLAIVVAAVLVRAENPFPGSRQAELLGHIGASAAITLVAAGLVHYRFESQSLRITLWIGMLATIVLEVAQGLTPTRTVQLSDIASGFAGVLVAAVVVDTVSPRISRRGLLRVLGVGAVGGTAVLLALFGTRLGPQSTSTVEPDGVTCALSAIIGNGTRIDLATAVRDGACVETAAGGLGIVGTLPSNALRDNDSVLVSSPLPELQATIAAERSVTLRAEIVTDSFGAAPRWPGSVVALEAGGIVIVQLMVRANRVEGVVHTGQRPLTSTVLSAQGLEPSTSYLIELRADESSITTLIDGEVVAMGRVGPEVIDRLLRDDLRLLIGNTRPRVRPFLGRIQWVEVEVAATG